MTSPRANPAVALSEKRRPSAVWLSIKDELVSDPFAGLKCNICNAVSVKTKKVAYCKACKTGWCATCLVLPESKICYPCTSFISKTQTVWVEGVVQSEFLGKFYSTSFLRIVGDYAVVYPSKPEQSAAVGSFDLCTAVSLLTTKYVYVMEATPEKEQSVGEACKEPGSMFTFTLLEGQKKVAYYFIAETAREAQMWIPAITKVVESYHAQFKKGAVKKQDHSEDKDNDQQVMVGYLRVLTGFPKSWKLMPFGLYKGGRFSFFKEDGFTPLKCANMFELRSASFHQCAPGSSLDGQLLLLSGETPKKSVCLRPLPEDMDTWIRNIPPVIELLNQADKQRKEQMNDEKLSSDDLMALAPKDDTGVPVSRDSLSVLSPTVRPAATSIAPTFGAGKWDVVRQKLIAAAQERKQTEEAAKNSEAETDQRLREASSPISSRKDEHDASTTPKSPTGPQRELAQKLLKLEERNVSLEAELADLKSQAIIAKALQKELTDLRALVVALTTKPLMPQVFPLPGPVPLPFAPPPLSPPSSSSPPPGSPPTTFFFQPPTTAPPLSLPPATLPPPPSIASFATSPPLPPATLPPAPIASLPPPPPTASPSLPPATLPPPSIASLPIPPPPTLPLPSIASLSLPPPATSPSFPPPIASLPIPPPSTLPPPSVSSLPPPPPATSPASPSIPVALPPPSLASLPLPPPAGVATAPDPNRTAISTPEDPVPPSLSPYSVGQATLPDKIAPPPSPSSQSNFSFLPTQPPSIVVESPSIAASKLPSLVLPLSPSSLSPSSPFSPTPTPGAPPPSPIVDEEARLLEEIAKIERIAALKKKLADLQAQA